MIKTFARSIREFKKDAFLAPFFVALEVVCDVLIPIMMSQIIDEGVAKADMKVIYMYGAIMFLLAATSLVFGVLSARSASRASVGFARNLRYDCFKRIQNYSFSNIDKFSTSSLITRLTIDISYIQMSFQMFIRILFRSPSMILFALAATLIISPQLGLIYVIAVPILGVTLYLLMSRAFPHFKRMFQKYDEINLVIGENLKGIRTVKSFVKEDDEIEKFEKANKDFRDFAVKAERLIVWNGPVLQATIYFCILGISLIGSKLVISDELQSGQLLSFFNFTYQILMNLNMLSMVLVMFAISKPSMNRVFDVLTEVSDIQNCDDPLMVIPDGSVSFKNVSFGYRKDKLVLKNINLKIEAGQTIGLIGGTGSAKSTLVSLISRLYDVTDGKLMVGGNDIKKYDIEHLRDKVAVVLQKNVLFSGTIRSNLLWGNPNATQEEIELACKIACADEFINSFPDKYDTVIDQGGTNVSGGQKQRLCIARALLKNPKVIILDDSTSAVDTKTDASIRHGFKTYLPHVTKIIIAQRIASISDADKIIVLDSGSIVGFGTHDELLKSNDIYREVFETQMKGVGVDE